jgi:hypothetical protein
MVYKGKRKIGFNDNVKKKNDFTIKLLKKSTSRDNGYKNFRNN